MNNNRRFGMKACVPGALAGLVSVVLGGCSSMSLLGSGSPAPSGGPPLVKVTVNAGSVTVDPETLNIDLGDRRPIQIRLDTPGYQFDAQGAITFGFLGTFDPGNKLRCSRAPTLITCINARDPSIDTDWYKYTLHLVAPDGKPFARDPWMNNH